MSDIVRKLEQYAIKTFALVAILLVCATPVYSKTSTKQLHSDWVTRNADGQCMVFTRAFKTRTSDEGTLDGSSFLYVVKKGEKQFSIGVMTNHDLSDAYPLEIEVSSKTYLLNKYGAEHGITFSSTVDVALINNMLQSNGFVKIKSTTSNTDSFLEYYSLGGFSKAMKWLDTCTVPQ